MAAVIKQAERIGASVANAMEMFAETLRMKRHQRADELAHKAAVKMLIPTVLCIFPAIFVVILGPAAVQVYNQLILGSIQTWLAMSAHSGSALHSSAFPGSDSGSAAVRFLTRS